MSIDTKIILLLDKYEERKAEINAIYDANYATVDSTPESTLALNMWFTEETGKLEKWYISELKKLFKGV
jgi:hypothetical protein